MRTRIAIALATTVGALAASAFGAGSVSAQSPPIPDELRAKLRAFGPGPARKASDCTGFCLFSERGFTAPGETGYIHVDCDPLLIPSATDLVFGNIENLLRDSGSSYSVASVLNLSSGINHCQFPVRLLREDGTGVTIQPGEWVWDLGASPFRINDAVSRLG